MQEASAILQHGNAIIFKKHLQNYLVDLEFYTNSPCVIYVESGRETITNSDNESCTLTANTALFLPQGLNLHSDYFSASESLCAYLIFFEDSIIANYLSSKRKHKPTNPHHNIFSPIKCGAVIEAFLQVSAPYLLGYR